MWDKFRVEGLREGHAVTTCNLETISAFSRRQKEIKKSRVPAVGRRILRFLISGCQSRKKGGGESTYISLMCPVTLLII
jgi:hypothetical protein